MCDSRAVHCIAMAGNDARFGAAGSGIRSWPVVRIGTGLKASGLVS